MLIASIVAQSNLAEEFNQDVTERDKDKRAVHCHLFVVFSRDTAGQERFHTITSEFHSTDVAD